MTNRSDVRFDVVLIGSGISSLTCAALLAKKGKSVCVLERYKKPGGYLHGFKRMGHRFETGAHYVGAMKPGQPFRQLLEYLGVYSDELFSPLDEQAFDVLKFPELTVEFPQGYAALTAKLKSYFPGEAKGIDGFFSEMQLAVSFFQSYRYKAKVDQQMLNKYVEVTLAQIVQSHTQNEKLKAVLYAHCLLHKVEPQHVAFGMHAIMMDFFITGPVGFTQGGDALAQQFVKVIEASGGQVHFRRDVVRIENTGDRVSALICSDGERIESEWFVSGIHLKKTFELFSDPSVLTPVFKDRLKSLPESLGTFGVYAVCKSDMELHPRRNYFLFGESNDMFKMSPLPSPPQAVFVTRRRTLDSASEETTLKFITAAPYSWVSQWESSKVGHRGNDYDNFKAKFSEMIWAQVSRYFPNLEKSKIGEVTSSPLSNVYFNGAPEGSSYGLYHATNITGPRAIGPRTHMKNLLLTGQNTLFPGFLGAATSGVKTAGHLLGIKELLAEIQGEQSL